MARDSRPPGFDMTYRPEATVAFAAPFRERVPSFAYFGFAIALSAFVIYGENAPSNSWAFRYVVEGDQQRLLPSGLCALVVFLSALAAVVRSHMRGVVVRPDGIELRELLSLGWPRVRRFHWSQIDRVFVPRAGGAEPLEAKSAPDEPRELGVDLWDGSRAWLPQVAETERLAVMLEKVALARAIPIVGGTGLIDDLGQPLELS